jgi:hypothetical protein
MADLRPEHPQFDGPPWQDAVRGADGWSAPREIRLTTSQPAIPEQFIDYIASVSWVAGLPEDQRAETLARVAAIVGAGEMPAEMPVRVFIGLTATIR